MERNFVRPDGSVPAQKNVIFIRPSKLFEEGVEGKILEGTFVGTVPNHFDGEKNDYKFEGDDGSIIILNGAGNLDYRMNQVSVGDYCRVEYLGKKPIIKGKMKGKEAHAFEVLIAK